MGIKYEHIDLEERKLIWRLSQNGASARKISKELSRSPSTISRELKRNEHSSQMYPHHCNNTAIKRRKQSYVKPRLKSQELQNWVVAQLKKGLSPEQISGRITLEFSNYSVCHESIYKFIYQKQPELRHYLCRHHCVRRKKTQVRKRTNVSNIPARTPISERPREIELREEFGHWESDLVMSPGNRSAVEVLVERKSRIVIIRKLESKKAPYVAQVIINALKPLPPNLRKTITYDNGSENSSHRVVNHKLKIQSFFCEPYHSWQKGTVENTIGLIRRVFNKKTDFSQVSQKQLNLLQAQLNNRPRKYLGFKTPIETIRYQGVALQGCI